MQPGTFENLIEKSDEYEDNFERLCDLDEISPERIAGIAQIQSWLQQCVDHGCFLPEGSPDRKELQSIVSFWTTNLRQNGVDKERTRRLARFDTEAGIPLICDCPYPGLEAYGEEQQTFFMGRDKDTEECLEHFNSSNILLLEGGSGSGKSSLSMAGILPQLKQDPAYSDWCFITGFTPGEDPFVALAQALVDYLQAPADRVDEIALSLSTNPKSASSELKNLFEGKPVMLFIDQFEELLTLCRDQETQGAFSDLLCNLAKTSSLPDEEKESEYGNCKILITLRTDHLARFENSTSLRNLHSLLTSDNNSKRLGVISFENIRQGIETPAKKVGLRFLPANLIDKLASQTASLAGGLPLLQFSLRRLWNLRAKDQQGQPLDYINEAMLEELPSVPYALGKVAEEVYKNLHEDEKEKEIRQKLCERLMLELVSMDENFDEPLRRRRYIEELQKILEKQWPEEAIKEVIAKFINKGLLRFSGDEDNKQIEVAHEAMFRNWDMFRDWVSGNDAKQRLNDIKLISREAADWQSHEENPYLLKLTGDPLKEALKYTEENWLTGPENEGYVAACWDHEKAELQRKQQAEHARELARQAQTEAKYYKIGAAVLFVIIVGVLVAFIFFTKQQNEMMQMRVATAAEKLPPANQLDLVYTAAISNEGGQYHQNLAHSLEQTYNTYIPPKGAENIIIGDQGAAIITKFDVKQPYLQISRICPSGKIDSQSTRINYCSNHEDDHKCSKDELVSFKISPPSTDQSQVDKRFVLLAYKFKQGYELRTYELSWAKRACAQTGTSPTVKFEQFNHNDNLDLGNSLKSASELSLFAFDKNGENAAFSTITYAEKGPESKLWLLNLAENTWDSVAYNQTEKTKNENVVTAVAFSSSHNPELSIKDRLITGRLNGALYCGQKRLKNEDEPDETPIRKISTSYLESEPSGWFAYTHESKKAAAWKCDNDSKENRPNFFKEDDGQIAAITMNNSFDYPVATYYNERELKCWGIKEKNNQWKKFACSQPHPISQFTITTDAKNLLTIESDGRPITHRMPLEFIAKQKRDQSARVVGKNLLLWNTSSFKDKDEKNDFKIFEAQPRSGGEITNAAMSPTGKFISWIERLGKKNHILYVSKFNNIDTATVENIENPGPFSLAINDNGSIILAGRDINQYDIGLKLIDLIPKNKVAGLEQKRRVTCIEFSPDGSKILFGHASGRLSAYDGENFKSTPHNRDKPGPVTACAIGNDGTYVAGDNNGNVIHSSEEEAIYKFKRSVKSVSIDSNRRYVSALSEWQHTECARSGLPGQPIIVWDRDNNQENKIISKRCLPNQQISSIGSIIENEAAMVLPIVTGNSVELLSCFGCASADEKQKPKVIFDRLIQSAEKSAVTLTEKKMEKDYGINFGFF